MAPWFGWVFLAHFSRLVTNLVNSLLIPKLPRAVSCRDGASWTLALSHPLFLFSTEWSGINALLYYGPTLIQDIGLKGDTVSLVVSGGIGIVQFIAVLPAIAYIDRVGRKPLLRGLYLTLMCESAARLTFYPF